nr:reverse transcriptase domain-containing protein [Tanacetum cinerariifolium]
MPLRVMTRSAGRPAVESLRGGTGVRDGRGGRGRRPKEGNDEHVNDLNGQGNDQGLGANGGVEEVNRNVEGANWEAPNFLTIIAQQLQNLLPVILAQVGNQGNVGNQNGNVVNENFRNVLVNGNREGCSYKEFLACNPKEYDVEAGHAAYTNRFYELARLVPHLITPESRKIERYVYGRAPQIREMVVVTEPKTMQKAVHISGVLTDEAVRNRSIKKVKKRENMREPSKDKNGRDDNKRTRTGNVFVNTVNPVGRENAGAWPKCTTKCRNNKRELAHEVVTGWKLVYQVDRLCCSVGDPSSICCWYVAVGDLFAQLLEEKPVL